MTTLHPHWQATDDSEDYQVPIRIVSKTAAPSESSRPLMTNPRAPSRRPAAFLGIVLCLIAGVAAFQGFVLSDSRGQVSSSSIDIHIRSTGADPVTVNVQPGTTITWTNDDTIPHILSSDTLPTADGQPFMTSAIFPGSSTHYLVPADAKAGSYAYISKTAQTVSGQINVQAAQVPSTTLDNPFSVPTTTTQQTSSIPPVQEQQSSIPETTETNTPINAAVTSGLPVNPHTVGNGEAPLPPRQNTTKTPAVTSHMPAGEPVTGPEVWVTILLTVGIVLVVSRKAFRTV